jgi:holo-[acyl-carrier protein] synthase
MIIRSGIDIVEIAKFAENLKNEAFIRKVFTPAEITACEMAINPVQCYAAKFAVKEAFMKALGQGIRQEVWFTQIEILIPEKDSNTISIETMGKASKILSHIGGQEISASTSHGDGIIVAMVVLTAKGGI